MKKVILTIALATSMITVSNVQEMNAMDLQPTATIISGNITGEDGFIEVKLEELSPAVQVAVNALTQEYDVKALKYNAEKQLTKVKLIKKEDQSQKTVYFDAEGQEVRNPSMKATKEAATEAEKIEQEKPSALVSYGMQDDGYADIQFDALNEKVQEAVRKIAGEYDITALKSNAEKQLTKVVATSKEDKSEKTFILNENGEEVKPDAAPAEQEVTEVPRLL